MRNKLVNVLLTSIDISRPVTLFNSGVESESRCATSFVMSTPYASAETLSAISFWVETVPMIASDLITN